MAAASASARLDTSCWVATSTGPLLAAARRVDDRMWVAAAAATTAPASRNRAAVTDHSR